MKNRKILKITMAAVMITAGCLSFAQTAEELLPEAIQMEEVKGELEKAIGLYRTIVENFPDNRPAAAKAYYHMGICYEKLGLKEAQKAYSQVVNNYSDQKNLVDLAKVRLSRLIASAGKELKAPLNPKFTKIEIPTKPGNGVLSPDGKMLAFTSEGDLWMVPIHGNVSTDIAGEPVRLAGIPGAWNFANTLAWSADGQWIAVNGGGDGSDDVYIIPVAAGEPRKIRLPARGGGSFTYRLSLSPDGKNLTFSALKPGNQAVEGDMITKMMTRYVYVVPSLGGESRLISSGPGTFPSFSPDGKRIAYVTYHEKAEQKKKGERLFESNLWIVNSSGGSPVKIAGADRALGGLIWSPDGRFLAANGIMDATSVKEIWIYQVRSDTTTEVEPGKIALPGISLGLLAGWTPENELGTFIRSPYRSAVYTVPSSGGKAVQVTPDGVVYYPRWSPDGKRIYLRWVFENEDIPARLVSIPASGGNISRVPWSNSGIGSTRVPGGGWNISPDGRKVVIIARGLESNESLNFMDLRVLSLDDGSSKRLTNDESHETYPCWSPDGKWIAFVDLHKTSDDKNFDVIYRIPAEGGNPVPITSAKDSVGPGAIAFSPNGKLIAFFSEGSIKTIPFEAGKSEILVKNVQSGRHSQLAWSPDGSKIACNVNGRIWITNLAINETDELQTGLPENYHVSEFDWSPDGKKITFMTTSGDEPEFFLVSNFLPLEKLAKNKVTDITSKVLTTKKIWNEPDTELDGAPSPDGKYLSYVDWDTGNLAVFEIATGKKSPLTNKGSWDESDEFALMSRWSPDSRQIVYEWYTGNGYCDIRITGLDGLKPRVLYSRKDVNWIHPYDWSQDGKQILAYAEKSDGKSWTTQIILISVIDGSVQILKTSDGGWPENMCFSPEGKYVVYDWPQKEDSPERDIFMLSCDGNREIPLVEHPGHDELFGWTPDGKNILFGSDRNGTFSLWSKTIEGEKSLGNAVLVKADIGAVEPLGFTGKGSFFYGISKKNSYMYMAELDPESGEIRSQPEKIITRFEGYNQTPEYSPDGKYLAFVSKRFPLTIFPDYTIGKLGGNVLCIKSLETGEERQFSPDLEKFIHPRWSPDGKSVIVMEWNKSGSNRVDLQTGNVSPVLFDENIGPQPTEWSSDRKTMYYVLRDRSTNSNRIIVRDAESGKEKEIYRINGSLHIRLSPDDRWLAVQEYYTVNELVPDKIPKLTIMPSAGGEPRVLFSFENGVDIRSGAPYTWTPDGKFILYAMKSPEKEVKKWDLYRISREGGTPEKLGLEMGGVLLNLSVQPGGKQIAFSVTEQSNAEVWVMENLVSEVDRIFSKKK